MKTNIQALQHIALIVTNTERSLHFYCELLQLQQDFSRPHLGYKGAWLSISAEQQIHLLELPNPDPIQGRPKHGGRDRHAAFMVHDLQLIVDQLNHAKIGYTLSKSGREALFCHDPDNNALEFIQVKDV